MSHYELELILAAFAELGDTQYGRVLVECTREESIEPMEKALSHVAVPAYVEDCSGNGVNTIAHAYTNGCEARARALVECGARLNGTTSHRY